MRFSDAQRAILVAMQAGDRLKVQRTLDGAKVFWLHPRVDDDAAVELVGAVVDSLVRAGLIESNMKFPAATFLLTDKGVAAAAHITGRTQAPTGPRNFRE